MTSKFIKLLPQQIPAFWETIKFAATQVSVMEEKSKPLYLNNLLHSLLNDKSQVFVRLDDGRKLLAIMITKIEMDKISGDATFILQSYYSWAGIDDKTWANDFLFAKEFASHTKCKHIIFESNNPKIWAMGQRFGFKEKSRTFIVDMEA